MLGSKESHVGGTLGVKLGKRGLDISSSSEQCERGILKEETSKLMSIRVSEAQVRVT